MVCIIKHIVGRSKRSLEVSSSSYSHRILLIFHLPILSCIPLFFVFIFIYCMFILMVNKCMYSNIKTLAFPRDMREINLRLLGIQQSVLKPEAYLPILHSPFPRLTIKHSLFSMLLTEAHDFIHFYLLGGDQGLCLK